MKKYIRISGVIELSFFSSGNIQSEGIFSEMYAENALYVQKKVG